MVFSTKIARVFSFVMASIICSGLFASYDNFNEVSYNSEVLICEFLRCNERELSLKDGLEYIQSYLDERFRFTAQYDPGLILFNCLEKGVQSQEFMSVINESDNFTKLRIALLIADTISPSDELKLLNSSYLNWSKLDQLKKWKDNAKILLMLAEPCSLSEKIIEKYPWLKDSLFIEWVKTVGERELFTI